MNIIETQKLIDLLKDTYNAQVNSEAKNTLPEFDQFKDSFLKNANLILENQDFNNYMDDFGYSQLNRIARYEIRPFIRLVDYRYEMRYLPNPLTNKILSTVFSDLIKDVEKEATEFEVLGVKVQNVNVKVVLFVLFDDFYRKNTNHEKRLEKINVDELEAYLPISESNYIVGYWLTNYIKKSNKDAIIRKFATTWLLKETIEYIRKQIAKDEKQSYSSSMNESRTISLFMRGRIGLSVIKYLNDSEKYNDKCPNLLILISYYLARFNGQLRIAPNVVIHSIRELLTTWNQYLLTSDDSSLNHDLVELTENGKEFMKYELNNEKYLYVYNELFKKENQDLLVDVFVNMLKNELVSKVGNYKNFPVEIIYIIFGYLQKTNNHNIVKSICDDLLNFLKPKENNENSSTIISSRKKLNDPYVASLLKRIFSETLLESPSFDFLNLWRPDTDLHLYLNDKLAFFYQTTFISEIKNMLFRYYPNYNREELDYDFYNLSELDKKIMYLIKLNWSLIKTQQTQKEFDDFMYAWIYNKTNLINTEYDANKILELENQYIQFDYINNNLINPICFVDNNLLSVQDRKVFSEYEYKGDKLYSIIINWLKINCEIKYDLDIKYPSSQFQKQLISSLNFSEIIQSNHLHHGKDDSFSESDYFEAYLWSLYLTHGSKVVYQFVLDLFKINSADYILDVDDKSYIDDQWYFDNKYSRQIGVKIPKIYYWKKLDYIKRGYSYNRVRQSLYSRTFEREFNKILNDIFALRQENQNQDNLIPLNYLHSKPDYVASIFFLNKFNVLDSLGLEKLIDELKDFKENEKETEIDFEFDFLD